MEDFVKHQNFQMEFMHTLLLLDLESNWEIRGKYPYFIGKSYESPLINDNLTLTSKF